MRTVPDMSRPKSAGKARPIPPPPPPPTQQASQRPDARSSGTPTARVTESDECAERAPTNTPDIGSKEKLHMPNDLSVDMSSSSQHIHNVKLGIASKSRNASTCSSEAGGKSPRPDFRKARPAPLPPKPPDKPSMLIGLKVNAGSKSSLDSSTKSCEDVFSGSCGTVNDIDQDGVCGASNKGSGGSGVQAASAHHNNAPPNKTTRKKSMVKPCSPPPQPPAHTQPATPQTARSCANSDSGNQGRNAHAQSVHVSKPVIHSPKPKIKPIVPPPPPPNHKLEPSARTVSSRLDESSCTACSSSEVSGSEPQSAADVSDMSELMRDVLGVIDRTSTRVPDSSAHGYPNTPSCDTLHPDSASSHTSLTSESQGKTTLIDTDIHSQQASDTLMLRDADNNALFVCSTDTKSSEKPVLQELSIQIDDQSTEGNKTAQGASTQSLSSPGHHSLHSPTHKQHGRAHNSPRHRLRRKHSALGLMLCCGLGRAYLRDKKSPPFELPMRTEGTLPRGNNVVNSTSLPTVLIPASHSPQKLEQSDISQGHATDRNHVINVKAGGDKEGRQLVGVAQTNTITDDKEADSTCSAAGSMAADNPRVSPAGAANKENQHTQKCDIIDALCPSEKPIAINKLQRDNKDLVVNRESASPSPTNTAVDITSRPVVHGVKLVERSSTFTSHNNGGIARGSPPRLSNTQLNKSNPDKPHSSHTDIRSHQPSITTNTADHERVLLRKDSTSKSISRDPSKVRSQSMEDLSCVVVDLDFDMVGHLKRQDGYRSSFVGEDARVAPVLTRAPGEVQTLLKHGKQDGGMYALPQPACYSDSTLRAVKLITDKYDTLERWKICATSFRGDQTTRTSTGQKVAFHATSPSRQSSRESRKSDAISGTGDDVTDGNMTAVTGNDVTDSTRERQESSAHSAEVSERVSESNIASNPYELSSTEKSRIKLFYSSRDTQVEVASCTVDLLMSANEAMAASEVQEWTHAYTGVPALVLTTGQGRARRQLSVVVCERHTSFPLWRDTVNHLSQYQALSDCRHTMHLSASLMKIAALHFPDPAAAQSFLTQFNELTQDSNDDLWKVAIDDQAKPKHKKTASKVKVKGDISHPIQFDHVTKLTPRDPSLAVNLATYVTKDEMDESESYRPRTYSG